jgi:hypothetical protein
MNSMPAFWGTIGRGPAEDRDSGWRMPLVSQPIWGRSDLGFQIHVGGKYLQTFCAWQECNPSSRSPFALVMGTLAVSENIGYDITSKVTPISLTDAPKVAVEVYQRDGVAGFGRLDGNFSLVLWDPAIRTLFLAVDRSGIDDIFYRLVNGCLRFASTPSILMDRDTQFDCLPTAFLLAQEGFVPAPFSISPLIKSIGRARYISLQPDAVIRDIQPIRYWKPSQLEKPIREKEAVQSLFHLLHNVVSDQIGNRSAVLVGGTDSTLLFNIAARLGQVSSLLGVTGTVKGYLPGEGEIVEAKALAAALGIEHESQITDPGDDSLVEDWTICTRSIWTGVRLGLPIWLRYARRMRSRLGDDYSVIAGQFADTLADNNFTSFSAGYFVRRAVFSAWFHKLLPVFRNVAPRNAKARNLAIQFVTARAGVRWGGMFESLMNGLENPRHFYDGRVFGYGEMPGRSNRYFPMLSPAGFEDVAEWFSSNFVQPVADEITYANFYRQMIDLSMDLVMLHLDSRLLFHLYRLENGKMRLPFMDTRVVNLFGNLDYGARALYREPKHIIRAQLRRPHMISGGGQNRVGSGKTTMLPEDILLTGSLGTHFRGLLCDLTFVDRTPGIFSLLDEPYFQKQITAFKRGESGVNSRYIARLAALEDWSRALADNHFRAGR